MIVEIPDDLRCVFSHISYLNRQIKAFEKGNNSLNLPLELIVPSFRKRLYEKRIELSLILEKAVDDANV